MERKKGTVRATKKGGQNTTQTRRKKAQFAPPKKGDRKPHKHSKKNTRREEEKKDGDMCPPKRTFQRKRRPVSEEEGQKERKSVCVEGAVSPSVTVCAAPGKRVLRGVTAVVDVSGGCVFLLVCHKDDDGACGDVLGIMSLMATMGVGEDGGACAGDGDLWRVCVCVCGISDDVHALVCVNCDAHLRLVTVMVLMICDGDCDGDSC